MKNPSFTKRRSSAPLGLLALLAVGFACSTSPTDDSKNGDGDSSNANPCATGQSECGDVCAELKSDPGNCGTCGNICDASLVCSRGTCAATCEAGETQCGASCADLNSSPSHCGSCNAGCASGQACSAGACASNSDGAGGSGAATGGGAGTGGGTLMVGPCDNTIGACTAPQVRVTEIDFGVPITGYGSEWDDLPLPAALAALPGGGTRVAARGTDGQIHVATLDCDDDIVGTPFALDAVNLQDIHSDDEGGVALLTRESNGSGEDNCGSGQLCGGTSVPCQDSYLVRFDNSGAEQWAVPVTNTAGDMDGYEDGALFIWERYQHHGRIAFDGENYAAYFAIGITTDNNSCVDIHQGDRFQVVSADGTDVSHDQERPWMCSHSWTTRVVWDPRSSEYMMTCATDNADPETGLQCRVRYPLTNMTIAPVDCMNSFWQGDLVLAEGSGYWSAYSQEGSVNLVHFTKSGPDNELTNVASSDHAKLVRYSAGKMLLAWEDGSGMAAQILNAETGAEVGSEFSIDVPDHNYHAFKEFPDGSVAYPAAGSTDTSLRIARVMPCQ